MKGKLVSFSFLAVLLSIAAAYGVLQVQVRIPATGNVKAIGLEVFSDQACTNALSNIDWGFVSPGENKTFTCYLKSLSNVNSSFALAVGNWVPTSANNSISLSWNRESYSAVPGEIVLAVLMLQVSSSIQGVSGFSFDVIVTSVEA